MLLSGFRPKNRRYKFKAKVCIMYEYVCMYVCMYVLQQKNKGEGGKGRRMGRKGGGGRAMKRIKINKNIKRSYIIITMSLSCIFRKEF